MKTRTTLLPAFFIAALAVTGYSILSAPEETSTELAVPTIGSTRTPNRAAVPDPSYRPAMIPRPNRPYVEAFDEFNSNLTMKNPCDDYSKDLLAQMGLVRLGNTLGPDDVEGCEMGRLEKDGSPQKGSYYVSMHPFTFEDFKNDYFIWNLTFPDADDRVYFFYENEDDAVHACTSAVSTEKGTFYLGYEDLENGENLSQDEFCRRAYEVMQFLRVNSGYK